METIKKVLVALVQTVLIAGLAWLGVRHFWGETRITSTLDGSPVSGSQVFIDGRYACETPCSRTLPIGGHTILVTAPVDSDTEIVEWTNHVYSLARGVQIAATFYSVPSEQE